MGGALPTVLARSAFGSWETLGPTIMKRDLRFEIVYPHPPKKVWQALTDPAAPATETDPQ
jgi:hypothetical protein